MNLCTKQSCGLLGTQASASCFFFVSWNHCGCNFSKIQQQGAHTHADQRRNSLTFTPSACACRPGALRPCVLTPGVFAGCGLGAGVVRTCVFPEFCRLLDDRTLPRLPTLPLRSATTHINTPDWFHHHKNFSFMLLALLRVTCQRFAEHPDVLAGAALLSKSGRPLRTRLCSPGP